MFRRTRFAPKFSELSLLFCYIKIKLYNYECRDNDPILHSTTGRMHSDAQFAGSSSVPAHVEMMGFLGMGNNPMVGATVAIAVAIQQAMN